MMKTSFTISAVTLLAITVSMVVYTHMELEEIRENQKLDLERVDATIANHTEEIAKLKAELATSEPMGVSSGWAKEEIAKLKAELATYTAFSHRHDERTRSVPITGQNPTPIPTLVPTTPYNASTDFEDEMNGWALHAILGTGPRLIGYPDPYSYYHMELTKDDSYHIPLTVPDHYKTTTHVKIHGEGWDVWFGLANIIDVSNTDKLTLSFDAKVAGLNSITYAPEGMPNLHVIILDDAYSKVVKHITLVGNKAPDQTEDNGPWRNYTVDLTPHIQDKTNLPVMIVHYDSWFADGRQVLWVDNIKITTD